MASLASLCLLGLFALLVFVAPSAAQGPDQRTAKVIADLGLREAPTPLNADPSWRKPRRVVVMGATAEHLAELQAVAPGVEIVAVQSPGAAREAAGTADAILGPCIGQLLDAAGPDVRWVHSFSAGVEGCVSHPLFKRPGVRLTNSQRVFGPAIAEHVMALVLAHARGLPGYLRAQRDAQWAGGNPGVVGAERAVLLSGKTMLVVGFGGIGTEVARRAHAFGMTVLAIRNSRAEPPPFVSRLGVSSDLAAWITEADVVVDTLPLTAETRGMFDAKIFAAMKRSAFFVNVGRGGTVVTADLEQALRQGTIAGAGLDVVDPEPLPGTHPLWTAPNLILTPHTSGDADDERRIVWTIVRENLRRYVAGGHLLSVVDVRRGY